MIPFSKVSRSLVSVLLLAWLTGCVTTVEGPFSGKADAEKAVQSHIQLGLAYIQQGDYVTAQQRLERALAINPKSAGAHAAMGLVYQRQGEPELAESSFKKALSFDGKYTRGRTYYAAFLYEQERFADAVRQFEIAAEDTAFEDRAQIFANIGLIQARMENYEGALQAYQRSLSLSRFPPPNVLLAMSQLLYAQGEHHTGWQYYSRFLNQVSQGRAAHSPTSLSLGATLAREVGDRNTEASLELLLRNRFPESPEAKNLRK